MEILQHIAAFDKHEQHVFFSELFDRDLMPDLIICIAGADQEQADAFLAIFTRHDRDKIIPDVEAARPVKKDLLNVSISRIQGILDSMPCLMEKHRKIREDAVQQTAINRDILKEWLTREKPMSDQSLEKPWPPVQKSTAENAAIIKLPEAEAKTLQKNDLFTIIRDRESRRKYTDEPLTLEELAFLLWSTQGLKKVLADGRVTIRTVPSAGARHPFETYIAVNNVVGLRPGVYRYLFLEHALELCFESSDLKRQLIICGVGQRFVGECAVCFFWSCIPYRTEWRYSIASHKIILLDAGHVCQNLYLACEAIGCGTCAVGSYHQEKTDAFLGLDGKEEFVIYLAPVGKVPR
ncbi:MAG: SagB/ThcOx family dehydrogenase [bacterium]